MVMHRHHAGGDAKVRGQLAAVTRVLRGYQVSLFQYPHGTGRQVLEVTDRRGDYIKCTDPLRHKTPDA